MIQKKNSVLIRKKRMRIEGNRKNHELSWKLGCEITHGCAMKKRRCSAIFVGNLRRQTPLQRQKGVQILEPQLCSNSFLQPLMFGLEPTEELVHFWCVGCVSEGLGVVCWVCFWKILIKTKPDLPSPASLFFFSFLYFSKRKDILTVKKYNGEKIRF